MFGQGTKVASLYAELGADVTNFKKGMGQADDMLQKAGGKLGIFSGALGTGLSVAAGVGAAGIAALGGTIIKATGDAANMQQALADITADLGLTADETAQVKDLISDLGLDPKLKVTAAEAAAAIHMLGKNGQDVTQILDGTARATVLLANSTGADFATSADIATDVMAQFGIQANDMMQVVNGITGTTRYSKFGINDYRLALAQAGGVAASVGVDFGDFNATIAAISPLFASGSDAGTSFKTFLQRLIPASKPAEKAMRELGLITEDGANQFFTATGEMKSMTEIAALMESAFGGLTEEQKNNYAATIFGTDAMRAAFGIASAGAATITDLKTKIGNTDAEAAAAIRMNTLGGQWEIFTGIVDTLSVKIGEKFLPVAQRLTGWLTVVADKYGPAVVAMFDRIAIGVDNMITALAGLFNGESIGDFGETRLGKLFAEIAALFTDTEIGIVWRTLWDGIVGVTKFAIGVIGDLLNGLITVLTGVVKIIRAIVSGDWTLAWQGLSDVATGIVTAMFDILKRLFGIDWKALIAKPLAWVASLDWAGAWQTVKDTAVNVASATVSFLRNLFGGINWRGMLSDRFSEVANGSWMQSWRDMSATATSYASSMVSKVRELLAVDWGAVLMGNLRWAAENDWYATWKKIADYAIQAVTGMVSGIHQLLLDYGINVPELLVKPFKYAINAYVDTLNTLIRTVNDAVSYLPGSSYVKISEVARPFPGYARGGRFVAGGTALVGENGPELVDMPAGTYVHNARETVDMMNGQPQRIDLYVHAQNAMPTDRASIRLMAEELQRLFASQGGRVVMA